MASLCSLGHLARLEQPERAARLYGAEDALRARLGVPRTPASRESYEETIAAVRAALDETKFAAAWREGKGMPLQQAIAYALESGKP